MCRPTKKLVALLLVGVSVCMALIVMYVWYTDVKLEEVLNPEESMPERDADVPGYIYMSASDPSVGHFSVDTYAYEVSTGEVRRLTDYGNYSGFASVDETRGLFMTTDSTYPMEHPDNAVLIVANISDGTYLNLNTPSLYNERKLTASPDEQHIAFMGQEVVNTGRDISTWQIMLTNVLEGTSVTIPSAVSPQWINQGEDVLFLKEDGIYVYNLKQKIEKKVFGEYINFSAYSEIAISPDEEHIVLTAPGVESRAIVLKVDTGLNMIEIGSYIESEFLYISPIISPDSLQYGFLLLDKKDIDLPAVLELYSFATGEAIRKVSLDMFSIDHLELNDWSNTFLLDTATMNDRR